MGHVRLFFPPARGVAVALNFTRNSAQRPIVSGSRVGWIASANLRPTGSRLFQDGRLSGRDGVELASPPFRGLPRGALLGPRVGAIDPSRRNQVIAAPLAVAAALSALAWIPVRRGADEPREFTLTPAPDAPDAAPGQRIKLRATVDGRR